MTYQIRIDGQLYESSSKLEEAVHLYETMDKTCLQQYNGHTKSLVCREGDEEVVMRKSVVKVRQRGIHF